MNRDDSIWVFFCALILSVWNRLPWFVCHQGVYLLVKRCVSISQSVLLYVIIGDAVEVCWICLAGAVHLCLRCVARSTQGRQDCHWLFAVQVRVWQIVCRRLQERKVKTARAVWGELHWSGLYVDLASWVIMLFTIHLSVLETCCGDFYATLAANKTESKMTCLWIVVIGHHVLQVETGRLHARLSTG